MILTFSLRCCLASCVLGLGLLSVQAQEEGKEKPADAPKEEQSKAGTEEESITEHTGTFGGKEVSYTATAGKMPLKGDDGKVRANLFYVAYQAKDKKPEERPVIFCFNGGPGSSSVWLHMGAFGPVRAAIPDNGTGFPTPPFELVANPHSLLSDADLVFIDPVSTGFSRADQAKAEEFHNFDGDVSAVADFIRLFVTRNNRWASPKYLAGESYGVIRAVALSDPLQTTQGMYLNGLVLVSGLLDFATLSDPRFAAPAFLPAMTAVAHFHKKLPEDAPAELSAAVAESENFARGEYTTALAQGDALSGEESERIATTLNRLTGIDKETLFRQKLVVDPNLFRKQLLKQENRIIGRFDGRVSAEDGEPGRPMSFTDPSLDNVFGAYSTLLNAYLKRDLKYNSDASYEILKSVNWNYGSFQNRFVSVGPTLREAFQTNPRLKVFVACGWHDLATPPEGIRHSINQLRLPGPWKERIETHYYEGGHMMYSSESSLEQLAADIRVFLGIP